MDFSSKVVFHQHVLVIPCSPQLNSTNKPSFVRHKVNTKWSPQQKQIVLCSISEPTTNYGGWEDLEVDDDSHHHHQFQNILVSLGIDDTKHVFMFILGFISALALSRVRVSSVLVFPATVFVFSLGFSLGFLRRPTTDFVGKKPSNNDAAISISAHNFNTLLQLFTDLNLKITNLTQQQDFSQLQQPYYTVIKSLSSDILQGKHILDDHHDDAPDSKGQTVDTDGRNPSHKSSSRRKREPLKPNFNVFHLFGSLLQENASVLKPNKVKDVTKRELAQPFNSKVNHNYVLVQPTEQVKSTNSELRNEVSPPEEASRNQAQRPQLSVDEAQNRQTQLNGNSLSMVNGTQILSSSDEFSQDNYFSQLVNNGNSIKATCQNGKERLMPQDNLYDPLGPNVNRRSSEIGRKSSSMEFKASFLQEENLDGYYVPSNTRGKEKNQSSTFDFVKKREKSGSQQTACDSEDDSASLPSSAVSEDLIFNKNLTEATDLLKEARGYFKGKVDEDRAEVLLYKCARLLSRATLLRPMSLLAVGQLGNTFLLHGELKLTISRELRTLLSRNDSFSRGKTHVTLKVLDELNMSRDRVASILVDVCEECEGLLVEAGRQYRMALSIDGSDVRALYNWGLALSYRAQLLADVGPEAASDADRVYLAAIDKFNEMMSRNKAYAPDALFRWGIALQERSRLRPSNAKEKMKLLQQAKSLFEDALSMDSGNDKVRGALSSCTSELNYRHLHF